MKLIDLYEARKPTPTTRTYADVFGTIELPDDCSHRRLTSLEGCPSSFDSGFWCAYNDLTSLRGGPTRVLGMYKCDHSNLLSLEGAPEKVTDFYCENNSLSNLKGGPSKVSRTFDCSCNEILTSLEGAPEKCLSFYVNECPELTSLKGAPKIVEFFSAARCGLTTLEGAPQYAKTMILSENKLTSLHNIHKHIRSCEGIKLHGNPITSHVLGLLLISGLNEVWLDDRTVMIVINKHLAGDRDVMDCQEELLDKGLEEYAQL